jgi:hypothetical protein
LRSFSPSFNKNGAGWSIRPAFFFSAGGCNPFGCIYNHYGGSLVGLTGGLCVLQHFTVRMRASTRLPTAPFLSAVVKQLLCARCPLLTLDAFTYIHTGTDNFFQSDWD